MQRITYIFNRYFITNYKQKLMNVKLCYRNVLQIYCMYLFTFSLKNKALKQKPKPTYYLNDLSKLKQMKYVKQSNQSKNFSKLH